MVKLADSELRKVESYVLTARRILRAEIDKVSIAEAKDLLRALEVRGYSQLSKPDLFLFAIRALEERALASPAEAKKARKLLAEATEESPEKRKTSPAVARKARTSPRKPKARKPSPLKEEPARSLKYIESPARSPSPARTRARSPSPARTRARSPSPARPRARKLAPVEYDYSSAYDEPEESGWIKEAAKTVGKYSIPLLIGAGLTWLGMKKYGSASQAAKPATQSSGAATPVAKPSPGKKSPGKKSPGRSSPGKKSPGKKSPGRSSPGRSSPGKKSPGKKGGKKYSIELSIKPQSPQKRATTSDDADVSRVEGQQNILGNYEDEGYLTSPVRDQMQGGEPATSGGYEEYYDQRENYVQPSREEQYPEYGDEGRYFDQEEGDYYYDDYEEEEGLFTTQNLIGAGVLGLGALYGKAVYDKADKGQEVIFP